MRVLIGHTGFVGSILKQEFDFDLLLHRENISLLHDKECDIICCGLPAEKWKANLEPDKDYENMKQLVNDISKSIVKSITVISTIDVYENPVNVRETDIPNISSQAYGRNRLLFEQLIANKYDNCQIVRLPGLFGSGLKKNIIFDLMNDNNIEKINCHNYMQWYPMDRFCSDLKIIQNNPEVKLINICTEPIHTKELVKECFPEKVIPDTTSTGMFYDIRTNYGTLFNGDSNYMMDKNQVLSSLKEFIK